MSDGEKPTWFEFPTLTQVPLNVQDVENLREMFEHNPGWKVMEKILKAEASRAGSDALDHTRETTARELDTVQFYAHVWMLQFPLHLEQAVSETEPTTPDQLMLRRDPTLLDLIFQNSS